MEKVMMKCGHVSNAHTADGKPCCAICSCFEVDPDAPNLEGRVAECSYCGSQTASSFRLPFFKYRPNSNCDSYYCGCFGWD